MSNCTTMAFLVLGSLFCGSLVARLAREPRPLNGRIGGLVQVATGLFLLAAHFIRPGQVGFLVEQEAAVDLYGCAHVGDRSLHLRVSTRYWLPLLSAKEPEPEGNI